MRRGTWICIILSLFAVLLLTSCDSLTEAMMEGGRTGLEDAMYEQAEEGVYRMLAPKEEVPEPSSPRWGQFMAMQAQTVFSYTFSAGGMWMGESVYETGEHTKFELKPREDEPVVMERAFLKQLDNGNQWWRAAWYDEENTYIYEGLLSPAEQRLLRLRARDPDGNEGEVPVSGNMIYMPPAEVGPESIEGATVGSEKVTTPAGTFQTDHVKFMSMAGGGETEWWITEEVPGGVVKYLYREEGAKGIAWTATLIETGDDAKTILKSY